MSPRDQLSIRALAEFAHSLADLSGDVIRRHFRRRLAVSNKADGPGFDPVTVADRAAERAMRKAVQTRFPAHGFVGEEFPPMPGGSRYRWIVDPIDGTRAFIAGSPLWGTIIALTDGGQPVLGLMDQPFTRERFWGYGRTARMRGPEGKTVKLATRACPRLEDAILTTTHPDLFSSPVEQAGFERVKAKARMTRYGGDCYGYCMLACGFVDLVIEAGLKAHDIAGLIPIIESAGGVVTTWEGKPAREGGRIVAAGDAGLHRQVLRLLAG